MTVETTADIAGQMRRLSDLCDKGVSALRQAAEEAAHAEQAYRQVKARCWVESAQLVHPETGKPETAGAREAWVDGESSDARLGRDLAEGMQRAALEALRTRRQQLSALQSWLAAERAEIQMATYGPEMTP